MAEPRVASKRRRAVFAAIASFVFASSALAVEPPDAAPVGPFDEAIPTPAVPYPPVRPGSPEPGSPETGPPFSAPLPPALPRPPAGPVLFGLPPPPTVPQPFRIPERPGVSPPPAGGLRQSLDELDREAGLGAGGPILRALETIAMSSTALGSAVYAIRARSNGQIESVRLTAANHDVEGFRALGTRLMTLSVSDLRLPEAANGVWLVVRIDTRRVRPAGDRRWYPGTLFAFDPSNIATHQLRVVHARTLSELWF